MKASRTTFLFSAFFATCLAAVHCGGDDSNNAVPASSGAGTNNNAGASGDNSSGASGNNSSGASGNNSSGASGSNGNAGTNGGSGTNGNGGSNGNAGSNGAGGNAGGGPNPNNNAACPGAAPMDGAMCTEPPDAGRNGLTCNYTAGNMVTNCDCARGNRLNDGGREPSSWQCNTRTVMNRDGGGNGFDGGGFNFTDGGACPMGTMNGGMCMTSGEYCRNGNRNCICLGNNNRTWRCQ
jgi:hypothetical protein